ncbi:hypothetical protein B0H14DRAFT_2832009, partial [Mycena olivaceomarginata]
LNHQNEKLFLLPSCRRPTPSLTPNHGRCQTIHQWRNDHLVCPILTIPNEITSEIFLHCRGEFPSFSSPTSPRYAPMLLLRVCRAWRSTALSTPRLWANLSLDFDSFRVFYFDAGNLDKFLEDYIARAGTCPLSLYVRAGHDNYRQTRENARRSIPALLKQLSLQIQHLELNIDPAYYPGHTRGFPLLRKLSLTIPNRNRVGDGPIQIFSTAPQLRDLYLCDAAPSLFAIPWETLAVFNGQGFSPRNCAHVLQSAPSLVDCTFFGNAHETTLDLDPATKIITHPNLKSFQFCSGLNAFFQHLTFPALETLIVEDDVDAVVLQFLSRSASSKYLAEFFPLLDRAKNPHFLPRLLVLELDGSPFVNMILVDALSSRSAVSADGAAELQSFRHRWSYKNPAAERQAASLEDPVGLALAELAKNGMEISLGG